jgi:hypothetical protein
MSNFWKIQCNVCGINCDLLKDKFHRIICRECLDKNEFSEVENEIYSEGCQDSEDCGKDLLHSSSLGNRDERDCRIQESEVISNDGEL